jgi:hypothetical protein
MTTPDQGREQPIELNKPHDQRTSGYPTAAYQQPPDYLRSPQTSGYPPLPDSLYPSAPLPEYPPSAGYPPVPYPSNGHAPGYGQPFPPGHQSARNGMGTAALVLGIIGVVLSWTVYPGFILGILAIVFGAIGLGRVRRGEATNRGAARAGLVLGIVALALLMLLVVVGMGMYAAA